MTLDEGAKILGVLGGVAGPLGLVLSVMNYRRDAARVRVKHRRGWMVINPDQDHLVRGMLADYERRGENPPMHLFIRNPDKTWASIAVSNAGRRPISITSVGWVTTARGKGKFALPGGYITDPAWLPVTLGEGESRDFLVEDKEFDETGFVAAFARDSLGRYYYGSITTDWEGAILRIKRLTKRRPFT